MNHVKVKVFGAFRNYIPDGVIEVHLPTGISVLDAKNRIALEIRKRAPNFSNDSLIQDSALGNEDGIFSENQTLGQFEQKSVLALLPPVCGG